MEVFLVLFSIGLAVLGVLFWARWRKKPPPPLILQSESKPRGLSVALAGLQKWVGLKAARLSPTEWEGLEETLLAADVSVATAQRVLNAARAHAARDPNLVLTDALKVEVNALLQSVETGWSLRPEFPRPCVISVVGVNGVGKTTTVGKLAHFFAADGHKVLLGAVDSFRAAAIEQLRVWATRSGADFVSGREGADPAATAFDAVAAGKARGMDVVLLDTAGRLHTKGHLMDELKRVHKVVKKVIPEAPHETWLVIDGTLGQNSVVQAREFNEALGITGVVVTKLDGTARGGALVSIAADLKLPLRFMGVGEAAQDLKIFNAELFSQALLQTN